MYLIALRLGPAMTCILPARIPAGRNAGAGCDANAGMSLVFTADKRVDVLTVDSL